METEQWAMVLAFLSGQMATVYALLRAHLDTQRRLADNAEHGLAQRAQLKLLLEAVLKEQGISPSEVLRNNGHTPFDDEYNAGRDITIRDD